MSNEKEFVISPTRRPYWQVRQDFADASTDFTEVKAVGPLTGLKSDYYWKAVEAFEAGDTAGFDMASQTYDDISRYIELEARYQALLAERRKHPMFIPSELGRMAISSTIGLHSLKLPDESISKFDKSLTLTLYPTENKMNFKLDEDIYQRKSINQIQPKGYN